MNEQLQYGYRCCSENIPACVHGRCVQLCTMHASLSEAFQALLAILRRAERSTLETSVCEQIEEYI